MQEHLSARESGSCQEDGAQKPGCAQGLGVSRALVGIVVSCEQPTAMPTAPARTQGLAATDTTAACTVGACRQGARHGPTPPHRPWRIVAHYLAEVVRSQSPGKPAHEKLQRVILLHGQAEDGPGGLQTAQPPRAGSPRRAPHAHPACSTRAGERAATSPRASAAEERGISDCTLPGGGGGGWRRGALAAMRAVAAARAGVCGAVSGIQRGADLAQRGGESAAAGDGGGADLERRAGDEGGSRREA